MPTRKGCAAAQCSRFLRQRLQHLAQGSAAAAWWAHRLTVDRARASSSRAAASCSAVAPMVPATAAQNMRHRAAKYPGALRSAWVHMRAPSAPSGAASAAALRHRGGTPRCVARPALWSNRAATRAEPWWRPARQRTVWRHASGAPPAARHSALPAPALQHGPGRSGHHRLGRVVVRTRIQAALAVGVMALAVMATMGSCANAGWARGARGLQPVQHRASAYP